MQLFYSIKSIINEKSLKLVSEANFGRKVDLDRDEKFVKTYSDMVYKLALSRTRNPSSAADVFQEVFYRYFKKRPVFLSVEHEKAWLIRVTINCSKSFLTSFLYKQTVPLDETHTLHHPEFNDVFDCVMRLPIKYRTVVFLFYYENLSIAEIAQATNYNENTIKSHLRRARILLKERLTDYEF